MLRRPNPVPPLRIRRIDATDGTTLRQVRIAALTDSPHAFGENLAEVITRPPPSFVQAAVRQSASPESTSFFLESGEETVGMVGAWLSPDHDGRGYVSALWVAPAYRAMGAGAALVSAAARWLLDGGAKEVCIWIAPTNPSAISFYERLGFRQGSRLPDQPKPLTGGELLFSIDHLIAGSPHHES